MKKKITTIDIQTKESVATVTLNRPELHNAFNEVMVAELTQAFTQIAKDKKVRVLLLTGAGNSFCAGADLHWMKKMAKYSTRQNIADAKKLHRMLLTLYRCPKPTLALVNGPAIGGGVGLVAAVDMAFAYQEATFRFSEVHIGLIPAVISPFVLRKIGEGAAREYFLTGGKFAAERAFQIGLVNDWGSSWQMKSRVEEKISFLCSVAPQAIAECKKLLEKVSETPMNKMEALTPRAIAARRASAEGKEGMNAFLNKRPSKWTQR